MYLIFAIILFSFLSGYKEGMIMIQYKDSMFMGYDSLSDIGVRCHKYFGFYHLLGLAILVSYSIVFYLILSNIPSIIIGTGLLFLVWEMSEIGYNYSRYAKLIVWYEHLNFGDMISIKLDGWKVLFLHIIRLALSITFIISGSNFN